MKFSLCINMLLWLFFAGNVLASDLKILVPDFNPGEKCQKLNTSDGVYHSLYKTFDGDIKNFRLYDGKWSPHYDGGYDEVNKKWLGYDWVVKRTLPESREQQIYVDPMYMGKSNKPLGINPFSLRNGDLFITARSIPPNLNAALPGFAFTSGLLTTRTSFLQMYGYFEIEAIVPQAPYLVPAFWLLPFDKSWPPEVDVFEAPGHEPGTIITTIHAKDAAGKFLHTGCRLAFQDFDKAFHKYGVLWLPDRLIFYIDRKPVSIVSSPVTFNKPMYMLANLAVGGNWVGFKNSTDGMPVSMVVRDMAAYTLDKAKTCSIVQGGVRECQGI